MKVTNELPDLSDNTAPQCGDIPFTEAPSPHKDHANQNMRLSHVLCSGLLMTFFVSCVLSMSSYFLLFKNVDFRTPSDNLIFQTHSGRGFEFFKHP